MGSSYVITANMLQWVELIEISIRDAVCLILMVGGSSAQSVSMLLMIRTIGEDTVELSVTIDPEASLFLKIIAYLCAIYSGLMGNTDM